MNQRIIGYDLTRTIAILVVFFGHSLFRLVGNEGVLVFRSLSPGIVMSLLGFISAVLLSGREEDAGSFLIRRFTRIYISLFLSLLVIVLIHAFKGRQVISQHMFLHLMGLSMFFELFQARNNSTIGDGLWFVTVIVGMYLLFPAMRKLFGHRNGALHLLVFLAISIFLSFRMYGAESSWNVLMSFSVGVYLKAANRMDRLLKLSPFVSGLGALCLWGLTVLSITEVVPAELQAYLYVLYPLAFVPLFFAIARRLPTPVAKASQWFAGLSYEFYILHFYFIPGRIHEIFDIELGSTGLVALAFASTLALAYPISLLAARLRVSVDGYLLANAGKG